MDGANGIVLHTLQWMVEKSCTSWNGGKHPTIYRLSLSNILNRWCRISKPSTVSQFWGATIPHANGPKTTTSVTVASGPPATPRISFRPWPRWPKPRGPPVTGDPRRIPGTHSLTEWQVDQIMECFWRITRPGQHTKSYWSHGHI